jgi:rod shape determining protein RodA
LRFLPETEADFIFASLAEELGFVGVAVIIFLYGLFFWRLLKIVHTARDDFSQLLALGLTTLFFLQFMINVGMVAGLLPVTGLPLPFISSGGSFLIISLIGVGVLESVAMKNRGVI